MHRVALFIVTAVLEVGIGLLLLLVPAVPLAVLLGVEQAAPESLLIARITGVALLAIGAASWLAPGDERSAAQVGLLIGILIYDVGAAGLLTYAGLGLGMAGLVLWPAVAIHAALAGWSLLSLRARRPEGKPAR